MLYLFTGNSRYLIEQNISVWKKQFIEKYGDFNLIHIKSLADYDSNFIVESLTALSFWAEKKLTIIDIDTSEKNESYQKLLEVILNNIPHIPEHNIIALCAENPDKRTKFFKEISKQATIKQCSISETREIAHVIEKKYSNQISADAITTIMRYKWNHLEKIIWEIDKLLISYDRIEEKYIYSHIVPELEESIFQCIDDILWLKKNQALEKIYIILEQTNIYGFYNNLIANLRPIVYIQFLKTQWIPAVKITEILKLWNRSFLANKNYSIGYDRLSSLYHHLVSIDGRMKSGKLLGSEEKDICIEIEQAILKI